MSIKTGTLRNPRLYLFVVMCFAGLTIFSISNWIGNIRTIQDILIATVIPLILAALILHFKWPLHYTWLLASVFALLISIYGVVDGLFNAYDNLGAKWDIYQYMRLVLYDAGFLGMVLIVIYSGRVKNKRH